MKAVIISGGSPPTKALLEEELKECSYLICADSGADCLYKYNIMPDYLIGDFDSIDKSVFDYFFTSNIAIEKYPKDKDFTDTKLALFKARKLGADEIIFLGCTGGRLDHTVGNFGLLLDCLNYNIKSFIKDDNNAISITNISTEIYGEKGESFSLLAYNMPVENLTIKGAKFELENYYLNIGDGLTLSNEFLRNNVNINFYKGTLLMMRCKD